MNALPRITIITPSFNQAPFLTRTLQSIHAQQYPNLQHIVLDANSTDGSRDILEQHRAAIEHNDGKLIIEPDHGQTHAINKGLERATGEIVTWICSDDLLLPGALHRVAQHFLHHPEHTWIAGASRMIDPYDKPLDINRPCGHFTVAGVLLRSRTQPFNLPQPSVFWKRSLHDTLGLLDESLHYCMDFEFWLRLLHAGHKPHLLDEELAAYRLHDTSKTCAAPHGFLKEHLRIEKHYGRTLTLPQRYRLWRRLGYQYRAWAIQHHGPATLKKLVAQRPWWLLSQQVRNAITAPAA